MIISSSILEYNISEIKRTFETSISELSSDGLYDYLPVPVCIVQSPISSGPFWRNDVLPIEWDFTEPLINLIPSTSVYLVSASTQILLKDNIPTKNRNFNWTVSEPFNDTSTYFILVQNSGSKVIASDVSPTFTLDTRTIHITSKAPSTPLIANQGQTYILTWSEHGTSNTYKIELLDVSPGKPNSTIQTIEDTYTTVDGTYTWNIENIEVHNIDTIKLKITDIQNSLSAVSSEIGIVVPYITINPIGHFITTPNIIGTDVIKGVGEGSSYISAFGFNPSSLTPLYSSSFSFQYSTTNAVSVYLADQNDARFIENLPLNGIHTIPNVTLDTVYKLNAVDGNNKLTIASIPVKIKTIPPVQSVPLTAYSIWELYMTASAFLQTVQTSSFAIIEPGAPVNDRISFYVSEASKLPADMNGDNIMYLLEQVNGIGLRGETLKILIDGVEQSPIVKLYDYSQGPVGDKTIYPNPKGIHQDAIDLYDEIERRYSQRLFKVSGFVYLENGIPFAGVPVQVGNLNIVAVTDANGYYNIERVPYHFSGSIYPVFYNYSFASTTGENNGISYKDSPIRLDIDNQSFIASPIAHSGNLKVLTSGIPYAQSTNTVCMVTDDQVVRFNVVGNNSFGTYATSGSIYIDFPLGDSSSSYDFNVNVKSNVNSDITSKLDGWSITHNANRYTIHVVQDNASIEVDIKFKSAKIVFSPVHVVVTGITEGESGDSILTITDDSRSLYLVVEDNIDKYYTMNQNALNNVYITTPSKYYNLIDTFDAKVSSSNGIVRPNSTLDIWTDKGTSQIYTLHTEADNEVVQIVANFKSAKTTLSPLHVVVTGVSPDIEGSNIFRIHDLSTKGDAFTTFITDNTDKSYIFGQTAGNNLYIDAPQKYYDLLDTISVKVFASDGVTDITASPEQGQDLDGWAPMGDMQRYTIHITEDNASVVVNIKLKTEVQTFHPPLHLIVSGINNNTYLGPSIDQHPAIIDSDGLLFVTIDGNMDTTAYTFSQRKGNNISLYFAPDAIRTVEIIRTVLNSSGNGITSALDGWSDNGGPIYTIHIDEDDATVSLNIIYPDLIFN